ncbi:MAG: OsmC family protein [Anaerolineae bacterium]|nr:OsmC family protein [Anaerolineae bacterium]
MTVKARVTWVEDRRFVGHASSGHAIVIDGSTDKLGPAPMELVLLGLLGCSAFDVVDILAKKKQAVASLEVSAQAERATDHPRVYTAISVEFLVRGQAIKTKAVEDAIRLSMDKYCSVTAMLNKTAQITTSYRIEE